MRGVRAQDGESQAQRTRIPERCGSWPRAFCSQPRGTVAAGADSALAIPATPGYRDKAFTGACGFRHLRFATSRSHASQSRSGYDSGIAIE